MLKKINRRNNFIAIFVISIMLIGNLLPASNAASIDKIDGFEKGPSYTSVVPTKKTTFVGFDENTYLDDYAYLAAVPTAVFKNDGKLISHPLLYYQEKLDYDDEKYRILDTFPGIKYFMEDWMSYCNGQLDQMTLINVPHSDVDQWDAKEYVEIEDDNPYDIASKIALQDWSYSKNAVVAVIDDEFEEQEDEVHEGIVEGSIPGGYKKDQFTFKMEKPAIGVGGNYESFEIDEPYKYVVANMYWENVGVDLDLQLYDDQLGMADADSKWNFYYGPGEVASSYVYNYGKWEVGVTYMPTQSLSSDEGKMESMYNVEEFKTTGLFGRKKDTQDVVIDLYPGVELDLEEATPFGCRDVEFKLTWDNPNVALGFILLDTYGAETASAPSNDEIVEGVERGVTERTIEIQKLGETTEEERYKLCVFTLDDIRTDLNFEIEYSWKQNITRFEGDCLASATEGAVLASQLNAPLLYVKKDSIPEPTENALYKLGVENIYLINLGGYLKQDAKEILEDVGTVKGYTEYKAIYDKIKDMTGCNDVIFSTIDPWTYYYSKEQVPVDDYPGALFIGPAALIAAHHGSPVLLVDNHPELSQAIVWHTKFWQETANAGSRPHLPSVACMVLTGRSVIEFLESYDYELPKEKDELATMITVADHFDIGITWDRTFTGRLIPGRFSSSPVDIAYWASRSFFYPALIFENPGTGTVELEQGSESTIKPIIGKFLYPRGTDLVVTKDNKIEEFEYPILHTYNVYLYNFNRDASKHWGGMYTTADGHIPYETPSPNPIDVGTTDKVGAFYPDIHETEVTPIYAERAGYSNVFSTNFDVCVENLNKGVIMWMESCHGGNSNYGNLGFWNPDSPYIDEPNPWRAYERPLMSFRNLDELVQYMPELVGNAGKLFRLFRIFTRPLDFFMVDIGATDNPDTALMNPDIPIALINDAFATDLHIKESNFKSLIPILGRKYRTFAYAENYGKGTDGVVVDPSMAGENVLVKYYGTDFDDKLGNLHSLGLNAVSCLVAHTLFHQVMIRHGTAYQILDPWSTSWYSGIWLHSIPRQIALGYTIGQAYEQGMAEVGIQYLVDQWWWDLNENVIFYGDPDLRVWSPDTEWDSNDNNCWTRSDVKSVTYEEKLSLNGHMPFGATNYPHEKQPKSFLEKNFLLILIVLIILLLVILLLVGRKKPKRK